MRVYTINDFKSLIGNPSAKSQQKLLQIIIDACINIIRNSIRKTDGNSIARDGHLMFQMATLRAVSIRNLSIQNSHLSEIDNIQMNAIDVASMMTLLRSITENFCVFYNMYGDSKTENELHIKYKLWQLAGLKNRQNAEAVNPEHVMKKEAEAQEIITLLSEIRANPVYQNLDEESKNILEKEIEKKNYCISFDGKKARYASWPELMRKARTNDFLSGQILLTTLNSHPSSISIMQFGPRYSEDGQLENDISVCLRMTSYTLSFFLADYIHYLAKDVELYQNLPQMHREVVMSYNQAFRNIN